MKIKPAGKVRIRRFWAINPKTRIKKSGKIYSRTKVKKRSQKILRGDLDVKD